MTTNSLTLSKEGKKDLLKEEGIVNGLYNDSQGYCTYGIGSLVHPSKNYKCYTLEAAESNAELKSFVKKWHRTSQLKYLDRSINTTENMKKLKATTINTIKNSLAKKKHKISDFEKLNTNQKKEIEKLAGKIYQNEIVSFKNNPKSKFAEVIKTFERTVNVSITGVSLNQVEYNALVSICFNIGPNGFKNSTFVKKINENKYRSGPTEVREKSLKEIEEAILMWKKPPDIISRRKREAKAFLSVARNELKKMKEEELKSTNKKVKMK